LATFFTNASGHPAPGLDGSEIFRTIRRRGAATGLSGDTLDHKEKYLNVESWVLISPGCKVYMTLPTYVLTMLFFVN
jgi:hypothetical protein